MPAQKTKSPVSLKLSDEARRKLVQHKDDEVKIDASGELPAGIEGGEARLVDAKVGVYKSGAFEGKHFIYLAATVITPATHNGQRVRGQFTNMTLPLCATGKEGSEYYREDYQNILEAMNIVKSLTSQDFFSDMDDDTDLIPYLTEKLSILKELGPHLKFRTWAYPKDEIKEVNGKWELHRKGKKQSGPFPSKEALLKANPYAERDPRINHVWQGSIEVNGELNPDAGVQDETGGSQSEEVEDQTEESTDEVETVENDQAAELDSLLDAANNEDDADEQKAAHKRILEIAAEHGVKAEATKADTWEDSIQIIKDAMGNDVSEESSDEPQEEETQEEESYTPDKGDNVYTLVKVTDPKTKKTMNKKTAVEVLSVNKKTETVDLKNLSDKKAPIIKGVKWADLIQE